MTPERRIDLAQRSAVDTERAMARLDGAIAMLAKAQRDVQAELQRRGWREPVKESACASKT